MSIRIDSNNTTASPSSDSRTIVIDYHEYMLLKYQSYQYGYIFAKQQEQLHELNKLAEKNYVLKKNNKLLKKRLVRKHKRKSKKHAIIEDPDTGGCESSRSFAIEDYNDEETHITTIDNAEVESHINISSTESTTMSMSPQFIAEVRQANTQPYTLNTRSQSQPCLVSSFSENDARTSHDEEDVDEGESRAGLINLVISLTLELAKVRSQCDHKDLYISKVQEERDSILQKYTMESNTESRSLERNMIIDNNNDNNLSDMNDIQENTEESNEVNQNLINRVKRKAGSLRRQSYSDYISSKTTDFSKNIPFPITTKKIQEKKEKLFLKADCWTNAACNKFPSVRRKSTWIPNKGGETHRNSIPGIGEAAVPKVFKLFDKNDEGQDQLMTKAKKRFSSLF